MSEIIDKKERKRLNKEALKQKEKEDELLAKKRDAIYKEMIAYEKKHKKEPKIAPKDSYVSLQHVNKIYSNHVQAVYDFNLEIKPHDFIVFVGPSGCGKSTTLRMIAGLEDITSGDLYIDGAYANDLEPKDRNISMVFQSYALYPHMTVYNNMAFGLKMRHVPRDEIDERVHKAAKILQIEEYLDRKPRALSGGQCQRVALGRAIVRNSKIFLMDEPLSNLDAKLRVQMRSEIVKLHEELGSTTIYVTHDQTEAMTMATKIVVLKDGYVQQIGSPKEIYNNPSNIFVATFIGSPAMNIVNCSINDNTIHMHDLLKIKLSADQKERIKDFYQKEIENKKNIVISNIEKEKENAIEEKLLANQEYKELDSKIKANISEINSLNESTNKEEIESKLKFIEELKDSKTKDIEAINKEINEEKNIFVKWTYKSELRKNNRDLQGILNDFNSFTEKLNRANDENFVKEANERIKILNENNEELYEKLASLKSQLLEGIDSSEFASFDEEINKVNEEISTLESRINNFDGEYLLGIRPEDIAQVGFNNNFKKQSDSFSVVVDIAELLGNEYYVHTNLDDQTLLAKVNALTDIKHNDKCDLILDVSKIHLFDKETKKIIF